MPAPRTVVIGAGIGGLAVAMRLLAAGHQVTVVDAHSHVGGKIRTIETPVGPADTGPTVLTMRHVFDDVFAALGERLEDHVTLHQETLLARHWWRDGATLDLHADRDASRAAIKEAFGARAASDYTKFAARAERLFHAFDAPMMKARRPSLPALIARVLSQPGLIPAMGPTSTMARDLKRSFKDPHLRQLFGRYATYVGGAPGQSPAVLSLISHAEAAGVWLIQGGLHKLPQAMAQLITRHGGEIQLSNPAMRLDCQGGKVVAVHTEAGRLPCENAVFNGDPRALQQGALGKAAQPVITAKATNPRSLSAYVYAFAAQPKGPDLAHHNVFFGQDPSEEFRTIAKGQMPQDPTLYVCAQDRGTGRQPAQGAERFEIIMNGAPTASSSTSSQEEDQCRTRVFGTLAHFGLTFDPLPNSAHLSQPETFNALFPHSQGSLYGRSPHGLMAAFDRPTAQTSLRGLYLVGGGAHPGAGIPMATLSARHAAETMLNDQTSTSLSRQMATPGGMSTA